MPTNVIMVSFKARPSYFNPDFHVPSEIQASPETTGSQLSDIIQKYSKLPGNRLRFTLLDGRLIKPEDKLKVYNLENHAIVIVKDLGPQIGWRTVFAIEYVGPLLIHPIFFFLQKLVYGKEFEHTNSQKLVFTFIILHYLKREYETFFIHKFSIGTMPMRNVFKNCFHYWIIGSLFLGYFVYSPVDVRNFKDYSNTKLAILALLWTYFELSNFVTHKILSDLRPAGSKVRKIPYGYGFDLVSCPNYYFEVLSWGIVTFTSRSTASLVFLIVSTVQMWLWAVKKHRRYRKEFGSAYPKERKAMFPFIA